jgi:ATP-dependent DNA helicase DinG
MTRSPASQYLAEMPTLTTRTAQLDMADAIAEFLKSQLLQLIEAPTGTGKSLAYLVPVFQALASHELRGPIVIATGSKALQTQLLEKDIPRIIADFAGIRVALAKSKSNYLCKSNFAAAKADLGQYKGRIDADVLQHLDILVTNESWDGDLDNAPIAIPGTVREQIAYSPGSCLNCLDHKVCFVRRRNERLKHAQVIVTNHHLLCQAARYGKGLPPYTKLIIDEAHKLPATARDIFTDTLKKKTIDRCLKRVLDLTANADVRNLVKHARRLQHAVWDQVIALPAITEPLADGATLSRTLTTLAECLRQDPTYVVYHRDKTKQKGSSVFSDLDDPDELTEAEAAYAASLRQVDLADETTQQYLVRLNRLVIQCDMLAALTEAIFTVTDTDKTVYVVQKSDRDPDDLSIDAVPLHVEELLREYIYTVPTALTSATLVHARPLLGFAGEPILKLPTPFDYAQQAVLYVSANPILAGNNRADTAYYQTLANEMWDLLCVTEGRAFLLFTARSDMEIVFGLLQRQIIEQLHGTPLLQNGSGSLIQQFLTSPRPVLFGLKTYWEGVDIQGAALSLVVFAKLPFDQQSIVDAIQQERDGFNSWWTNVYIPKMYTDAQQGLGRLIRSTDDIGIAAILDYRIFTKRKSYGERLINALPFSVQTASLEAVRIWWQEHNQR